MRKLEAIESDLVAAREALLSVEGTPTEVYSRIVGYYRSVRNWNRGKREEYGERLLYQVGNNGPCTASRSTWEEAGRSSEIELGSKIELSLKDSARLLLFVRLSCPNCPPAKRAAEGLGIPLELIDTDTEDGMAEAVRRRVMSAPTAILLSTEGKELKRAYNAEEIGRLHTGTKKENKSLGIAASLAAAIPIAV